MNRFYESVLLWSRVNYLLCYQHSLFCRYAFAHAVTINGTMTASLLSLSGASHEEPSPSGPASHRQRAWNITRVLYIHATFYALLEASPDPCTWVHLWAAAARELGAWLSAPPEQSVGLCMDDDVIFVTVGLCLGAPLYDPYLCCHWKAEVDPCSIHGLSCRLSRGWHPHYAVINDEIKRSPNAAKIPCWKLWVCLDQMARGQMEQPSFPRKAGRC